MSKFRLVTAALAASTLTLLASSPLAATLTVTSSTPQGWTFTTSAPGGAAELVSGPGAPPAGTGSAHLFTGTDGSEASQLRQPGYTGTRLADVTALSYWTYATSWNGSQIPYIILNLDLDGNGTVDDLLFFEPEYQSGVYRPSLPVQGPVALGTWQRWHAEDGGWWSLNGIAGANPGSDVKTLAEYLAAEPDATLANAGSGAGGLRVISGFASPSDIFDANVDLLTFGVSGADTSYDFEALMQVGIDVRPRNADNQVNTNARQLVPIAILGSAGFDPVTEVDPASVKAHGASPAATQAGTDDVNGDGFRDLTLYFRARNMTKPTAAECGDPDARLTVTGFLYSGLPIAGSDHVAWLGPDCP